MNDVRDEDWVARVGVATLGSRGLELCNVYRYDKMNFRPQDEPMSNCRRLEVCVTANLRNTHKALRCIAI